MSQAVAVQVAIDVLMRMKLSEDELMAVRDIHIPHIVSYSYTEYRDDEQLLDIIDRLLVTPYLIDVLDSMVPDPLRIHEVLSWGADPFTPGRTGEVCMSIMLPLHRSALIFGCV